jgi:CheY-like chemotaxis protein
MSRVLVVDDSRSAREVVEMVLSEAGYDVAACGNGKAAVARLQKESFDLIITDIYMPENDGLEVIQSRRRICPQVPVIAMSGETGTRSMLAVARHMGACQTIRKPFSKADLLDTVWAALHASAEPSPEGPRR